MLKTNKNFLTYITIIALLLLITPITFADVYLEQVTKNKKNNEETTTKLYISENAVRIEEPDGKIINITDFQSQRLITLDTENKEFFTIPLSQIKEDLARGAAHFRNSVSMNWRVEDSSERETIAGHNTRKIVFHGRGEAKNSQSAGDAISITLELWIANTVPLPEGINSRILDALGFEQNPFVDAVVVGEIKRMGGYPLRSITSIKMATVEDEITQEVLLVSEIAPDPQRFAIPADYKEIEAQ
jgi:hypothetical protein